MLDILINRETENPNKSNDEYEEILTVKKHFNNHPKHRSNIEELTLKWLSFYDERTHKTRLKNNYDQQENVDGELQNEQYLRRPFPSYNLKNINNHKLINLHESINKSNFNTKSNRPITEHNQIFSKLIQKQTSSTSSKIIFSSTSTSFYLPNGFSTTSYNINDYNYYKNNEFYSIFVSILTAAVFLLFIMWRWFRMKSDLRKALREQYEIQQQERLNANNSNNNNSNTNSNLTTSTHTEMTIIPISRWISNGRPYPVLISNNREELQATAVALINQLSNGEYRTSQQHQQMINAARFCLQQLKLHARLTQYQRQQLYNSNGNSSSNNNYHRENIGRTGNNYYTFSSRPNNYRSNLMQNNRDVSCSHSPTASTPLSQFTPTIQSSINSLPTNSQLIPLPSSSSMPPVPPVSSVSLSSIMNHEHNLRDNSIYNYSSNNIVSYQQRKIINEPPPTYESLLIKSSSLPSYCNLSTDSEKLSKSK